MPTFFIHIPKTAGTSLRAVITSMYRERCLLAYSYDDVTLERLRAEVHCADIVFGHFSFGFNGMLGAAGRYATMLRHPVDRVVSLFCHLARDRESDFYEEISAGMTLLELLRSERCHQMNNHMVRILGGHGDEARVHDDALLMRATANIENSFSFVGITESMDLSLVALAQALSWPGCPQLPRLNVDPQRASRHVDKLTREEIVRHNELDLRLYQAMRARLRRSVAPSGNFRVAGG